MENSFCVILKKSIRPLGPYPRNRLNSTFLAKVNFLVSYGANNLLVLIELVSLT